MAPGPVADGGALEPVPVVAQPALNSISTGSPKLIIVCFMVLLRHLSGAKTVLDLLIMLCAVVAYVAGPGNRHRLCRNLVAVSRRRLCRNGPSSPTSNHANTVGESCTSLAVLSSCKAR
jgi:hypothetical protein